MGTSSSNIELNDFVEVIVTTSKTAVKVFSMSDIHCDTRSNSDYLSTLNETKDDNCFTVFICNGDLCTDIFNLRKAFEILKAAHDEVCFVPGNHELWRRGSEVGITKGNIVYATDSLCKFNEVIRCARHCGVRTGPLTIHSPLAGPTTRIYPLYSWYHSGFDTEKRLAHSLYLQYASLMPFEQMWMDFRQCQWPPHVVSHSDFVSLDGDSTALAALFASINDSFLPAAAVEQGREECEETSDHPVCSAPLHGQTPPLVAPGSDRGDDVIISFSHFVPRIELIPEKRLLLEPSLALVSGSHLLEAQIRRLRPHVHIYGHTHIPIDMTLAGIRYIQWPLGYASEHDFNCKAPKRLGPLLLFDSSDHEDAAALNPHQVDSSAADNRQDSSTNSLPGEIGSSGVSTPARGRSIPRGLLPNDARSPTFHSHYTRYYRENLRTPDVTDLSPRLEQRLRRVLQLDTQFD